MKLFIAKLFNSPGDSPYNLVFIFDKLKPKQPLKHSQYLAFWVEKLLSLFIEYNILIIIFVQVYNNLLKFDAKCFKTINIILVFIMS